jgi:hypothetical protein
MTSAMFSLYRFSLSLSLSLSLSISSHPTHSTEGKKKQK